MLTITVPGVEYYDERLEEFVTSEEVVLDLEHSLVSLSKWEETWEKPFLGPEEKTTEQMLSYIRLMVLTPKVSPETFARLSEENFEEINTYINRKMTATWFKEESKGGGIREIITAEIIYFWMTALTMDPAHFEGWHLNRLFTLIKVMNEKNKPEKKKSPMKADAVSQRRALNAQRKAQAGHTG